MPVIDSVEDLIRYFRALVPRWQEIISGGTPSEEELTIDGPDRDSPFAQIYATIIGRISDIPPEIAGDDNRLTSALNRIIFEEIGRIGQEIEDAGGWAEWVEANYPDPEEEEEDQEEEEDPENSDDAYRAVLEEIREAQGGLSEEDEAAFGELYETIKGQLPTSIEDVTDILRNILNTAAGISTECEEGRILEDGTETGGWGGVSVNPDTKETYSGWKDCVNLGAILPGLDIPLPPGMGSVTWRDLEVKVREAGESFEDFLEDPTGWVEEKIEDAIGAIKDAWGDLTSGAIFSTSDLDDFLSDLLGGWLASVIAQEVQDALEVDNPFLFAGDCEDPAFRRKSRKRKVLRSSRSTTTTRMR